MASITLTWLQRIHGRFCSMRAAPAARMRSATSSGGRLIYFSCAPSSDKESNGLAADDVRRDVGTSRSLSGRYGLTGAEWCGDRRRLPVDVWRSSAAEYEDALVSEGLPAGRL